MAFFGREDGVFGGQNGSRMKDRSGSVGVDGMLEQQDNRQIGAMWAAVRPGLLRAMAGQSENGTRSSRAGLVRREGSKRANRR